jgi:hypothetical protein
VFKDTRGFMVTKVLVTVGVAVSVVLVTGVLVGAYLFGALDVEFPVGESPQDQDRSIPAKRTVINKIFFIESLRKCP